MMKPPDLVRALLASKDADERRSLLIPRSGDFYITVVELLKEEADRERLRDPDAALEVAEVADEVAEFAAIPRCWALAAWARANVLIHRGDYAECLRLYREAARFFAAEGDEIELARLLSNQAFVLKNLARYEEGLRAAQKALAILKRHPPSTFLASTLNGLGILYRLLGRYEEALAAHTESERIYAALGEKARAARVILNKANVLRDLDRFTEAIHLLKQARAALADRGWDLEVARADLNLGITYTRLGRYDEALAALDRAEKGFAALGNRMEVAVVELHRADLYADFNLYEELLRIPAPDWRLFKERQMQWHAARAALHKAHAWRRLGEVARATELLDEAQTIFSHIGDPIWARLVALERAALWCETGEWERALPLTVETATFLHDKGMPVRAAGASLLAAECHLALGHLEEAARRYREALGTARELDIPALLYRAYYGLGRVAQRRGHLRKSHTYLRRAVRTVERLRRRLRMEDFRIGFLEDKLRVYQDAVLLCLRLGYEKEAFSYVERAKSGALVDFGLGPRFPGDEALLARLDALRERLNWYLSRFREEGGEPYPNRETWQRISDIEREIARTWQELQRTAPLYTSPERPDLSTPRRVRADLHEGEVLLQYFVAGESICVFIVDRDGLRVCLSLPTSPSQVREAVDALDIIWRSVPNFDKGYVSTTLTELSRQMLGSLYEGLMRPLMPFLREAKHLLIAPDGPLFEVPFHALHDGEAYLLERYEVTYTPSAGVLRLCRESRRRRSAGKGRPIVVGYSGGGELPHIVDEIRAVSHALPEALVLMGEEATLARLRELAGRSPLLHLATHALFRRDNPMFSALQLSGGEWLRVMDLYTLRLDGALVTLSGCETGRHRLRGGDLLGLSRGFLCAGASALVVSLWPVADISTALLMERFYARLASGETASSALREAQLTLRQYEEERDGRRIRPYSHPFFWAPFCLLGAAEIRPV